MRTKELIIKLIQQDLKHSQLVYGMNKLGFDGNDKHHLQLFDLVYTLMKVPEELEIGVGEYLSKIHEAILVG